MHTHSPPLIAFIGGGNMADALIGGLIRAGHPPARLRAVEIEPARAQALARAHGIDVTPLPAEAVSGADAVVIAVKPQQVAAALRDVRLPAGTVVVSIAAGVTLGSLRRLLGQGPVLVRCMPNTPALVGQGITGLYADAGTPAAALMLAETILKAAGITVRLTREADLDAVTALSGSGPAYFFLFTEALREAGVALGLAPATAAQLAQQTLAGAAAMVAQSGLDLTELRNNVTSKGGTTEAALARFEAGGLRQLVAEALRAAQSRSAELGQQLAKDL
jgi:pyrroline-5-carboxylate reductase